MCIALHRHALALAAAGALVALASCGGSGTTTASIPSNNPAAPAVASDLNKATSSIGGNGRTDQPAQAVGITGSGYETLPLLTAKDEMPLLGGNFPNLQPVGNLTYAMPGTPDGLGVYEWRNRYYVWSNQEFTNNDTSSFSSTVSGTIKGARVSLYAFDKNWRCLGGQNLIRRYVDNTGVIGTVTRSGNTVTQTGLVTSRFCSSTVTTLYGGEPIYLTGEEVTGGHPFAIYTNGDAVVINDLPRLSFENICPISNYRNKTVLFPNDDKGDAFLTIYVGNRTGSDPNGFLTGTSYVARVNVGGVLQTNTAALTQGTDYDLQWIEVPRSYLGGDVYDTPANFYTWAGTVATRFQRPEDIGENPNKPGEVCFTTTGAGGSYDPFGRTWKIDLANGNNPVASAKLRLLTIGGPGGFYSPDNVVISDAGRLWICEDPSGTQGNMLGDGRKASIWNTDLLGSGLTRVFEVTQATPGFTTNPWETSGIIEVPGEGNKTTLLFDVQAHDILDQGGSVEGGQLLLGSRIKGANGHGGGDDDDDNDGNGHGNGHGGDDDHGNNCN